MVTSKGISFFGVPKWSLAGLDIGQILCACLRACTTFAGEFWGHKIAVLTRVIAKKHGQKGDSAFKMCSKSPKYGPGTPPACSVVGTLLKLRLRRNYLLVVLAPPFEK